MTIVPVDLDPDQDERQRERHQDQKIADLQHRLLRMRDRAGACDQLGGAAEEGVVAGLDDDAGHVALLGDAAGIGRVAHLLRDRQRLSRQRRLIDGEIFAVDQEQIGRHDLPGGDIDDVARHEIGRVDRGPFAVAQHPRLRRQPLLQGVERVGGLVVLPEADRGVVEQQARRPRRNPTSRGARARSAPPPRSSRAAVPRNRSRACARGSRYGRRWRCGQISRSARRLRCRKGPCGVASSDLNSASIAAASSVVMI